MVLFDMFKRRKTRVKVVRKRIEIIDETEPVEKKQDDKITDVASAEQYEQKGFSSYSADEFDDALDSLNKAIEMGSTDQKTFKLASEIYIRNKDLDSACDVLNTGIERGNEGLNDILENVECKISTGSFKVDRLPRDKKSIAPKIKEAKANIKKGNVDEGVNALEEIMANGTFNNTVYNTLFVTYMKEEKYDDAIRVCQKAIDELGYFSKDRFERWNKYLDEVTVKKSEK